MDKYNKLIGVNIKFVRVENGMSLQDLANLLDVTKQCIKRIEDGRGTTTTTFFKICSALSLPPHAFLSEGISVTREFEYIKETQ